MEFAFHPNEGVVLVGCVEFLYGIFFIVMGMVDRKYTKTYYHLPGYLKAFVALAAVVLILVLFFILFYLDLPGNEMRSLFVFTPLLLLGIFEFCYILFIDNTKLDKKIKQTKLSIFVVEKKITFRYLHLMILGISFTILGIRTMLI